MGGPNDDRRALGAVLARLRTSAGLTQEAVAHRCVVSRTYISHAEAGRQLPGRKFWEAAGVYRVAVQGALLVTFGLTAANVALAPLVAGLHAAGETARLQRVVTESARIVLLWSLPVALLMIFFGRWMLSTLFSDEFAPGATALAILSAAQLLNAGMGSVGLLLTMSGHERDTARGVTTAAAVNLVLNALLIPGGGIEGAAAATALSLVVWNVLLALWVHRRLGLHATALGRIDRRTPRP